MADYFVVDQRYVYKLPVGMSYEAGALIEPSAVAEAILFMLTRPRNVTIRDIVVLPSNFDI